MNSWLMGAAGIVVGLGVGWIAGRGVQSDPVSAHGSGKTSRSEAGADGPGGGGAGVGEMGDKNGIKNAPGVEDLARIIQGPTGNSQKLISMREMLAGLPVDALRTIALEVVSSPQPRHYSYAMLNVIGELWVGQDPESLLRFAQDSVTQTWQKGGLMVSAVREIALTDRNRAVALASSTGEGHFAWPRGR